MGFSLYYRSTRPVSAGEAAALRRAADAAIQGRSWLSCEPVKFYADLDDGRLLGSSKPNFQPHPGDAASATQSGLPDGDVASLIAVLCRLSRDHGVDWQFSHDYDPGPIGFVRKGVCDARLEAQIQALGDVAAMLNSELDERDEEPFGA